MWPAGVSTPAVLVTAGCLWHAVHGCVISGYDSGTCLTDFATMQREERMRRMPFCGRFIDYSVCVPEEKALPADRNFPEGRWTNHTYEAKDSWVREMAHYNIRWRVDVETNKTLQRKERNEWWEKKTVIPRFYQNRDCKMAYIRLMCWINFPRCDEFNNSLMVCEDACKNFFKSCQYDEKLWRCGPAEEFNKYTEYKDQARHSIQTADGKDDTKRGETYYLPDFFPGQPFAMKHCTGAAFSTRPTQPLWLVPLICTALLCLASSLWR